MIIQAKSGWALGPMTGCEIKTRQKEIFRRASPEILFEGRAAVIKLVKLLWNPEDIGKFPKDLPSHRRK